MWFVLALDLPSEQTAQVHDKKVSKRATTDDFVAHFASLICRNSYSFTKQTDPTVSLNRHFFASLLHYQSPGK